MCDGGGLGLIQMTMTPTGLVLTAAIAALLFLFVHWVHPAAHRAIWGCSS
jgi:hypothetical protein